MGSCVGGDFGADCARLSPGGRRGDASFAVVLPDAAAGSDGVFVHPAAFERDYAAAGRTLFARNVLKIGRAAARNGFIDASAHGAAWGLFGASLENRAATR